MPEFAGVKRILVIKLRLIGDVLLATPVFRALKARFPGAEVAALVSEGTEGVLEGNPCVDEVFVYPRGIRRLGWGRRLMAEIGLMRRIRARGFDMTVSLTTGDRAAFMARGSGARYRLAYEPGGSGFPFKRFLYTHLFEKPVRKYHASERDLGLLRAAGVLPAGAVDEGVELHVPERARLAAEGMLAGVKGRLIHVHPTASKPYKCWPPERMAALIRGLRGRGYAVAVTAGPAEWEIKYIGRVFELLPEAWVREGVADLAGRTSLMEVAAISLAACAFVGMDSAPMHMAAAVGAPVVALFGPTKAHRWGPRGGAGGHIVIQREWECVPCSRESCTLGPGIRCLEDITPDEVVEAVDRLTKKSGL